MSLKMGDLREFKLSLALEHAVSLLNFRSVFILNHKFIYLIQLGPSRFIISLQTLLLFAPIVYIDPVVYELIYDLFCLSVI